MKNNFIKTWMYVSLVTLLFASAAKGDNTACGQVLDRSNWTHNLSQIKAFEDPRAYLSSTIGGWVAIEGYLFHYKFNGRGNKIHAHMGGLGDSLEKMLHPDHSSLFEQINNNGFRTLTIEYQGQGDVEVVRANSHASQPVIPSGELKRVFPRALAEILRKHNLDPRALASMSGLSFGGQTLAQMHSYSHVANRIVLLASGVTNYNNFLLPESVNLSLDFWTRTTNFMSNGAVEAMSRNFLERHFERMVPSLADDPVKLRALSAMTLGAGHVDIAKDIADIKQATELMIFSALDDKVLPGMLHYELMQEARNNAHISARLILLEGVGHHIPSEVRFNMARTLAALIADSGWPEGEALLVGQGGEVRAITLAQAQARLKQQTQDWWSKMKEPMQDVLGPMSSYVISPPAHWFPQ